LLNSQTLSCLLLNSSLLLYSFCIIIWLIVYFYSFNRLIAYFCSFIYENLAIAWSSYSFKGLSYFLLIETLSFWSIIIMFGFYSLSICGNTVFWDIFNNSWLLLMSNIISCNSSRLYSFIFTSIHTLLFFFFLFSLLIFWFLPFFAFLLAFFPIIQWISPFIITNNPILLIS